jgi:hypothetical protein
VVPAVNPEMVVVVPVPVLVAPPGEIVTVQVPDEGNPVNSTLPVGKLHVGCVIVPITGVVGVVGWELIIAFAEDTDVHPAVFVTVKVYVVPAVNPVKLPVVPVPVIVAPPGEAVTVHVPEDGKPLRATLPVATAHVGWVIVPITGAVGVTGCALIIAFEEATEVHPAAFVSVKVYVAPAVNPVTVVVVPVPVLVAPPGVTVTVQVPELGNPLNATLPVGTLQVGCVIVPTIGVGGVPGAVDTAALVEAVDVHPPAFVTVKV